MSLFADLRYAARTLSKSPVFCSVAILSPALGIGANAGIFTLLDHVMLHLLPVEEPNRLAQLVERGDWYGSIWSAASLIPHISPPLTTGRIRP